jgi:hypothetical protein
MAIATAEHHCSDEVRPSLVHGDAFATARIHDRVSPRREVDFSNVSLSSPVAVLHDPPPAGHVLLENYHVISTAYGRHVRGRRRLRDMREG